MIEEFEHKGTWWLPNSPTQKIDGTITYTPTEGALLRLNGHFTREKPTDFIRPKFVIGILRNGKNITLKDCFENRWQGGESSIVANWIFLGKHYEKEENIKYKSMAVCFTNLFEWVNTTGFNIDIKDIPIQDITIKYKRPEPIELTTYGSYKIRIVFGHEGLSLGGVQKDINIKQTIGIKIEAEEEKSYLEFLELINRIKEFLCLAISEPVYVTKLLGKDGQSKLVEIYRQQVTNFTDKNIVQPHHMLFKFSDIKDNVNRYLNNWFIKVEYLDSMYSSYFSAIYKPDLYMEHEFLSYFQAIEIYHRREMQKTDSLKQETNRRLDSILSEVKKDEDKKWLNEKLKYAYEPNVRNRLKEVKETYPKILSNLIDRNTINQIVNTRNYLIHFDAGLSKEAAKDEDLLRLIEILEIIVQTLLLNCVGFNENQIESLFKNHWKYRQILEIHSR